MGGIILYTGAVTLLGLPELTGLHHIAGHQTGGYSQAAQKQCACSGEMHTISPPVLSQKKRHRIHTSGQTARVHVIAGAALKFPGHQIPQLQPGQIPRRRLPLLQNLLPCPAGSRLLYLVDHIGQFRYIPGNSQVFFRYIALIPCIKTPGIQTPGSIFFQGRLARSISFKTQTFKAPGLFHQIIPPNPAQPPGCFQVRPIGQAGGAVPLPRILQQILHPLPASLLRASQRGQQQRRLPTAHALPAAGPVKCRLSPLPGAVPIFYPIISSQIQVLLGQAADRNGQHLPVSILRPSVIQPSLIGPHQQGLPVEGLKFRFHLVLKSLQPIMGQTHPGGRTRKHPGRQRQQYRQQTRQCQRRYRPKLPVAVQMKPQQAGGKQAGQSRPIRRQPHRHLRCQHHHRQKQHHRPFPPQGGEDLQQHRSHGQQQPPGFLLPGGGSQECLPDLERSHEIAIPLIQIKLCQSPEALCQFPGPVPVKIIAAQKKGQQQHKTPQPAQHGLSCGVPRLVPGHRRRHSQYCRPQKAKPPFLGQRTKTILRHLGSSKKKQQAQ